MTGGSEYHSDLRRGECRRRDDEGRPLPTMIQLTNLDGETIEVGTGGRSVVVVDVTHDVEPKLHFWWEDDE